MRKNKLAILAASMILLSLLVPAFLAKTVMAEDPAEWYMTVNGVLDSDHYSLYPFASNKSLKLGLSKFGELINSNTNVSLEYGGARDPFAPVAGPTVPPELGKHVWINGWYIDIRYNHSVWGYRNVWAGAMFADITDYGGPWLRVDNNYDSCTYEWQEAFNLPGKEIDVTNPGEVKGGLRHGGRKTNGTVLTDPMQVLYDGPRLFVAKITNHIYDWWEPTKANRHLVDLVLTVIFNKVKKEVIVVKDVKLVPPAKFEVSPLYLNVGGQSVSVPCGYLVQLSNREEWDLGTVYPGTTSYSSYVHFYVDYNGEEQLTAYDYDWTMLPTLPETGVSIKGVRVNKWGSEPDPNWRGEYDVVQVISNDKKYVGWHAFWPSLSDWSVTAGDDGTWFRALKDADPHTTDGASEPWRSPLVVGEWDFLLSDQERLLMGGQLEADVQFRAVSVYGVTDLHDGDDEDIGTLNEDRLDSEVLYQLNEIFNPWDLWDAVEKETSRFVIKEAKTVTVQTRIDYCVGFEAVISNEADTADGNPDLVSWFDYCNFTERVIVDGVVIPPTKTTVPKYAASMNATGHWFINVTIPAGTHTIKILWSNTTEPAGRYEWIVVGRDAWTVDSAGAALVAAAFKDKIIESILAPKGSGAFIGLAGADMYGKSVDMEMPWVMAKFGAGNTFEDYYYVKPTDQRMALKDDWCGTWPISSSNMIGVGGPLANALTYYFNDFVPAFYALPWRTTYTPWSGKIVPLTCWDVTKTSAYASTNTVGYGVISTYKDINGTVGFLVWGNWGRDTYYLTKWFHEEGIYQLQEAPEGLTAIIVEIDYKYTAGEGYKPTGYSIVECLGTISETLWKHNSEIKGGIHDP
ncbi:MAG: hypothetical protein QXN87_04570 [Candidatus Bathyarchaeia archaeon]